MPRYRRPRRQGVVYGPVTHREHGSDGGFLGRILGMLIVLGAVAVLGVGAFNFVAGPGAGAPPAASPSPTLGGIVSPSPAASPSSPLATASPTPTMSASPSAEPSPDRTPFAIEEVEGPGSIIFGTGRGPNLSIRQPGTSFELGERIFYLAELSETTATSAQNIEVSKYDVETDVETLVAEPDINTRLPRFFALRQRLDTAQLDGPGYYVMRFMRGNDVIAEGWFEVTEP